VYRVKILCGKSAPALFFVNNRCEASVFVGKLLSLLNNFYSGSLRLGRHRRDLTRSPTKILLVF